MSSICTSNSVISSLPLTATRWEMSPAAIAWAVWCADLKPWLMRRSSDTDSSVAGRPPSSTHSTNTRMLKW